ncbi:MAG: endo-1,4-beta-xylanase [Lachnospiraceae bacterium]|nr:endo-1,4-beta-xylanase [Lachnospiraceae bacterium]
MKKWTAGLLAVLMAFSITACGAEDTNVPVDSSAQESTVESVEESVVESSEATETSETEEVIDTETLKYLYGERGIKAGTCLSEQMLQNGRVQTIIKTNFNSITLENNLKPEVILSKNASQASGELTVEFTPATTNLLDWCVENDMALRGHTLVWYSQTPNWIFYEDFDESKALVSREVMLERMESFIRQTFEKLEAGGYLEHFYAYDVVNEAWMEDGTKRDCLWLKTIGDDYMWYAFHYADKYAPEYVDLYYNDYNEQFKTETLYNFVQTLVDDEGKSLIDGIGLQAHLYTEDDMDEYLSTVERLGSTGLKVNLTELDICLGSWPVIAPKTKANQRAQGRHYYNLVNGLFQLVDEGKVKMDSLTFWGINDQMSWRRERNPALFDNLNMPKFAYYGAMQMQDKAGFDEE